MSSGCWPVTGGGWLGNRWRSAPATPTPRRCAGSWRGWPTRSTGAAGLTEPHVRDWAVRDYKRWVKAAPRRWALASVNQALAALDNFYRHLGAGRPQVGREELPRLAPRALDTGQQRVFLRTVDACPSPRDRALAVLLFYTALRLSELAALDVEDVTMTARRGRLQVRSGKGDAFREVPLNVPAARPCRNG